MNIFYLSRDPAECARMHCDKHVVKMIIEYAQLMSTAHRLIDGTQFIDQSSGRKIKRWHLNDHRDDTLYLAAHVNHPSNVWVRSSSEHYNWLYTMWSHLLKEYTHRYHKAHATGKLMFALNRTPNNLHDTGWIDPPQAMPDECKLADSVSAYRQYYVMKKSFAKWTNRDIPVWYSHGVLDLLTRESQLMGLYD